MDEGILTALDSWFNYAIANFSDLTGEVIVKVLAYSSRYTDPDTNIAAPYAQYLVFVTASGKVFVMYHVQGCCESVSLAEECDFSGIVGQLIISAEEAVSTDSQEDVDEDCESFTWTFYKIQTVNECITFRWFGESNGYYSESVDFVRVFNEQYLKLVL